MRRSAIRLLLSSLPALAVALLAAVHAAAQASPLTLTPALVEVGAPELLRVDAAADAQVTGEWLKHPLKFFRGRDAWYALAGVDVEAAAGPSAVTINISDKGHAREISVPVEIHAAHYRSGSITVQPKFVEPGAEDKKLIEAASLAKQKAFASGVDTPLWTGSFVAPVKAAATDSFGTRRMFNGKLASIHKGMDFRAPTGTVVRAGNAGTVLLAQPLYYEGNCIIIDHGMGVMTYYMHLSRFDVKAGQHVAKGEALGLSGATGRVTGPHLHWAVRWDGAMLDPAKMLRVNLDQLP